MTRKTLLRILRVALTAGFLVLVVRMVDFDDHRIAEREDGSRVRLEEGEEAPPGARIEHREGVLTLFSRMDLALGLALAVLLLVPISILGVRWWMLMRAAGVPAPLGRVLCISYAGAFFNLFLPGMVGGDIAKAVLSARGEERKAAVVGTVLLDRAAGLVSLVLMASVMALFQLGSEELRRPVILVLVLMALSAAGYAVYFSPVLRTTRLGAWLKRVLPFAATIRELDGVAKALHRSRTTLAAAVLLSLAAQCVAVLVICGLARALGCSGVSPAQFFLLQPILFVIMALPASIGGWGVGEYAFAELYGLAGMAQNQAVALSVLYKLVLMAASLPGGLLFAFGLAGRRRAPPANDEAH